MQYLHPIVYQDDDAIVFMEKHSDRHYFHCKVMKWNKSVYQKLLGVWFDILDKFNLVEAYVPIPDGKVGHFASMFGFEYTDEYITYDDGVVRRVMICRF